jgi:hypothetical protein
VQPAGDRLVGEIGQPGQAGVSALDREAACRPVGLPGDVVVDLGEAELLEPPRGPRAQVSERVVAVDDDRLLRIELSRCPLGEVTQRDVDGTGQVLVVVLPGGQHLDELGTVFDQSPHLGAASGTGHKLSLPIADR